MSGVDRDARRCTAVSPLSTMSATDSDPALRDQALMSADAFKNHWLVATAAIVIYDFGKILGHVCDNNADAVIALTFGREASNLHFQSFIKA